MRMLASKTPMEPREIRAERAGCTRLAGALVALTLALGPAGGAGAQGARVAVFDNPLYVDTGGTPADESDTLQASLSALGHTVTPYTSTYWGSIRLTLEGVDVVAIPELEVGDLVSALDADARRAYADFVAAGGVFITFGSGTQRNFDLLNAIFDRSISGSTAQGSATLSMASTLSGTRFVGAPDPIPRNDATYGILGYFGGIPIYMWAGLTVVGRFDYGGGHVLFLGWDWYDAVPLGSQDGGWLELLDRAVLEGLPPVRRVMVFDDPNYVDSSGGFAAESDAEQSALVSLGHRVERFEGTTQSAFSDALGGNPGGYASPPDVLVFPELTADLAAVWDLGAQLRVLNFVENGGVLVFHGANANDFAAGLVNATFDLALIETAASGVGLQTSAVGGTLLVGGPLEVADNSATGGIDALPPEGRSLYETAGGETVAAVIPRGEGSIVFLGWDWFNSIPLGFQDGGWLELLDRVVRSAPPPRRVALLNDPAYVDTMSGDTIADPNDPADAEALNLRGSLAWRDHIVAPFEPTSLVQWSEALAGADALVIPELEIGDLAADTDPREARVIHDFVKRGGLLITHAQSGGRNLDLLNKAFGFQISQIIPSGGAERVQHSSQLIPLWTLPVDGFGDDLESFSLTRAFDNLPPGGRSLYQTATSQSTVSWVPVGAGAVLLLGWDWYHAAPVGPQESEWINLLDVAVQNARPRARHVAVFADPAFVDASEMSGSAESYTVQVSLASLDHIPHPFSGTSAGDFDAALRGVDTLLIPELEVADLAGALSSAARRRLRDFVRDGGALIVHGDSYGRGIALMNDVFGLSAAMGAGLPPTNLTAAMVLSTRFSGGPDPVPTQSATYPITGLPDYARLSYKTATNDVGVAQVPWGGGRIIYLGWDWWYAAPVGSRDGGWLELLDRAVQEGRRPVRRVAVFNDPNFVDTDLQGGEAPGVESGLFALGCRVVSFAGTSLASWSEALATSQLLHVPELETGDLAAALPPETRERIADFVAQGGWLVTHGGGGANATTHNTDLLNSVFGFSTSSIPDIGAATLGGAASGTPFEGGPATLPPNTTVGGIVGLPPGAKSIYDDPNGPSAVAWIPFGDGRIVFLGWDWAGAAPFSFAMRDGGWLEVLERVVRHAPPAARRVAVYTDQAFVDLEAIHVQHGLTRIEHVISTFEGSAADDFTVALAEADVLQIPELSQGDLGAALLPDARAVIQDFVGSGGVLITHGAFSTNGSLLDALFGFGSAVSLASSPANSALTGNTDGTQFAGGPPVLSENTDTGAIAPLPAGSNPLYTISSGPSAGLASVSLLPYLDGEVAFLGWNWNSPVPFGTQDGGWLEVFDRAVQGAPRGADLDFDDDGVADPEDVCPFAVDPGQDDTDGDGTGDVCECGDVDDDGLITSFDRDALRDVLAGVGSLAAPQKCNVRGAADLNDGDGNGLPDDCNILDAVVFARALVPLDPGILPVCTPAVPGP